MSSHDSTSRMDSPEEPAQNLKRRASSLLEPDETSRKRLKEDQDSIALSDHKPSEMLTLAEDLAQELQCGCCSGLVYRPVVVLPCQHFFCGSCCILWIRNGGTNCPACRGVSTIVTPSRILQSVIDTLLRNAPQKARSERERKQADDIYKAGTSMRIPVPREPSPEPSIPQSSEFIAPCPHCLPNNDWGWRCPQPIADPNTDAENAWRVDAGTPPGHGHCGNCENLLALTAPTTSRCDFCQVSFCGIAVLGRCSASSISSQSPSHFADLTDLILSADVYDCFNGNTVEVEIMIDYLTSKNLSPTYIYREIVQHIQSQPRQFRPLIEMDIFMDLHSVSGGIDPNPEAPRLRICKPCAAEILLYGLRAWWGRERRKGLLDNSVLNRRDCPDGNECLRQKDLAHAKEFNHIIFVGGEQAAGLSDDNNPPSDAHVADEVIQKVPIANSVEDAATSDSRVPPETSLSPLGLPDVVQSLPSEPSLTTEALSESNTNEVAVDRPTNPEVKMVINS